MCLVLFVAMACKQRRGEGGGGFFMKDGCGDQKIAVFTRTRAVAPPTFAAAATMGRARRNPAVRRLSIYGPSLRAYLGGWVGARSQIG